MTIPNKFICDGCGKICDGKDYGGKVELTRSYNSYGGPTINLLYCKPCWEQKQEDREDDE